MPEPLAYLNGRFVAPAEAVLSVFDAGLVFGATVTDFCRTYHRRLFRHGEHVARFRRDCAACSVPLPAGDAELRGVAAGLVEHNGAFLPTGCELAVVTVATPGPLGLYAGRPGDDGPATLALHTVPLPAERYRPFFDEGVTLAVAGHHAADPDDLAPPRHKHRSRLHWWRADRALRGRPDLPAGAVAVLLDGPGGCVTETAVGNLLVVRGGAVRTPPVGWALDGVSLAVVRELCRTLGVGLAEERLAVDDCAAADEMMLAGTGFGVAGVRRFEGAAFAWPGPITRRLLHAWGDLVQSETGGPP